MRMRKKKNLLSRMERCAPLLLADPSGALPVKELAGGRPLHLEIGCGKGRFICETAKQHPDIFYLAMEREENVLVMAMERALAAELPNVRFLLCDALRLPGLFPESSVSRLYINFCDPWPHRRHAKRRLTHKSFLALYDRLLTPSGEIRFKTDNAGLFAFSLVEIAAFPSFAIKDMTLDLHQSGRENIFTEYEERFARKGMPIYRLDAVRAPIPAQASDKPPGAQKQQKDEDGKH